MVNDTTRLLGLDSLVAERVELVLSDHRATTMGAFYLGLPRAGDAQPDGDRLVWGLTALTLGILVVLVLVEVGLAYTREYLPFEDPAPRTRSSSLPRSGANATAAANRRRSRTHVLDDP